MLYWDSVDNFPYWNDAHKSLYFFYRGIQKNRDILQSMVDVYLKCF